MEKEICSECKKLISGHTTDELFSCKLKWAKRQESISEEEATESFRQIKSGEYARMKQNKK